MATKELEHFAQYDYLVVNDNLETALKELSSIYVAARSARSRRGHYGTLLLTEARSRSEARPTEARPTDGKPLGDGGGKPPGGGTA